MVLGHFASARYLAESMHADDTHGIEILVVLGHFHSAKDFFGTLFFYC